MKSLGAAVRISNGSPPASRTASFTTFAMPSRWLKQIASSDELLTTAIFGLSMSASLSPSAFHWARRTASRGEPGSKLLLNALAISVVISHENPDDPHSRRTGHARRPPGQGHTEGHGAPVALCRGARRGALRGHAQRRRCAGLGESVPAELLQGQGSGPPEGGPYVRCDLFALRSRLR